MTINPNTSSALAPIGSRDRIEAIDTLRGFALLGIFVMNITGMALPFAAYFNPTVYGGMGATDFGAWIFAHLFFENKMMGIFSMLFGAGVVIMTERAAAAGRRLGRIYYRRIFWLLVFGLVHSYLLWHGDILVTYALCGFLLYLFRRRSPRSLIILGLSFLLFGAMLSSGGGFAQGKLRDVVHEIEAKVAAGQEMTPRRQGLVDQWDELRRQFDPTPEEINDQIATMRGDWREVLRANVNETVGMHLQAVPFMLFWRTMALMLLGMGLMKAGVFTAERSPDFYKKCMVVGFVLGIPIVVFGIWQWNRHEYDFIYGFLVDSMYNYFASVLVSLAYVGVVIRLYQSGKLSGICTRLAAVGRMALTNYLLQSILGIMVFNGYGLGLFGKFGRFELWWFILGIWALQLVISPLWLSRFRFGPAEWLWRSLTYWHRQPMRVERA